MATRKKTTKKMDQRGSKVQSLPPDSFPGAWNLHGLGTPIPPNWDTKGDEFPTGWIERNLKDVEKSETKTNGEVKETRKMLEEKFGDFDSVDLAFAEVTEDDIAAMVRSAGIYVPTPPTKSKNPNQEMRMTYRILATAFTHLADAAENEAKRNEDIAVIVANQNAAKEYVRASVSKALSVLTGV